MVRTNIFLSAIVLILALHVKAQDKSYINNRAPLRPNPYIELPLGAIRPEGWLREMMIRQKNGATGHLDQLHTVLIKVVVLTKLF